MVRLCLLSAALCCGLVRAAPAAHTSCSYALATMDPKDARFADLEKIYRSHLHLRSSVHRILPHFGASFEDILAAKSQLSERDIPFMVYAIARRDHVSAEHAVALGVLSEYGARALPCVDAGLSDPNTVNRVVLRQLQISIAARGAVASGGAIQPLY